jgi:small subunit ribosomal protein S8
MSLQDPIADMLCRIRNAQQRSKVKVCMPWSKMKESVVTVIKEEGYVEDFSVADQAVGKELTIFLKYHEGKGVITQLKRASKPSLRLYKSVEALPLVENGLGEAIVSTSKGVMTARRAKKLNQGGEIIAYVS